MLKTILYRFKLMKMKKTLKKMKGELKKCN